MTAYCAQWITNDPSPTLIRYIGQAGSIGSPWTPSQAAATGVFNTVPPWCYMQRVNLLDNGVVSAVYGDKCYTDTNVSTFGQAMVYVPQFCLYIDTLTANQVWYWVGQIGDTFRLSDNSRDYTFTAADIHQAFFVDGKAKSFFAISAYEAYVNSSNLLESKAFVTPSTIPTLQNLRSYAQARGAGWGLQTIQGLSAVRLLCLVEYASWNMGNILGRGSQTGGAPVNTGYTAMGGTCPRGNASCGSISYNTIPMSYRGVENLWGNSQQWIDGIHFVDCVGYILPQTAVQASYQDSTWPGTGYASTGITVPLSQGGEISYVNSWHFLPSAVSTGGQYCCDIGSRIIAHEAAQTCLQAAESV